MLSKESIRNLDVILGMVSKIEPGYNSRDYVEDELLCIVEFINALKDKEEQRKLKVKDNRNGVTKEESYELPLNERR